MVDSTLCQNKQLSFSNDMIGKRVVFLVTYGSHQSIVDEVIELVPYLSLPHATWFLKPKLCFLWVLKSETHPKKRVYGMHLYFGNHAVAFRSFKTSEFFSLVHMHSNTKHSFGFYLLANKANTSFSIYY